MCCGLCALKSVLDSIMCNHFLYAFVLHLRNNDNNSNVTVMITITHRLGHIATAVEREALNTLWWWWGVLCCIY